MSPAHIVLTVAYLVVLEGILSVDNALALAALVRRQLTDPRDRLRALQGGMLGAYAFRVAVVFGGVRLMEDRWVRLAAAIYLLYVAVSGLVCKPESTTEPEEDHPGFRWPKLPPLWSCIIRVELMDAMFSVDSIVTAFSVSNNPYILIAGALLGILLMRYAAQIFIAVIERVPALEKTAFVLVFLSGMRIIAADQGIEVGDFQFMGVVAALVALTMIFGWKRQ